MKHENNKTNHSLKDIAQRTCFLPFELFSRVADMSFSIWIILVSCSSCATFALVIATCWSIIRAGWVTSLLKITKISIGKNASSSWILLTPITRLHHFLTLLFHIWLIFLNILYDLAVERIIVWPLMICEFHKGEPLEVQLAWWYP